MTKSSAGFNELKCREAYPHFDFVNPDAPKSGCLAVI
jgi:hypothetical protein